MKKIAAFFVFLFINNLFLFSQIIIDGEVIDGSSFSKIYYNILPAKTKHLNAKSWVAKTFGDYKSVVQFEDDENYKLIMKGKIPLVPIHEESDLNGVPYVLHSDRDISFIITIDSRDDKYRVSIEDMTLNLDSYFKLGPLRESKVKHELISEYGAISDTTWIQHRIDSINLEIALKEEMYYSQRQVDLEKMKKRELENHEALLEAINANIIEMKKTRNNFLDAKKSLFKGAIDRCIEMAMPINAMLLSLSVAMYKDDDF